MINKQHRYDKDEDILIFYIFRRRYEKEEVYPFKRTHIAKLQCQKLRSRGIEQNIQDRMGSIAMRISNFAAVAGQKSFCLMNAAKLTKNVYQEWKDKPLGEHGKKCVEILKKEGIL